MKVKLITTVLLTVCGVGIGWLAFENLMWAVWGKQNRWFEYVGFWGCAIMFLSGLVVLKNLRVGTFLGTVGLVFMLFYLGPALVRLTQEIITGRVVLRTTQIIEVVLIIGIPIITLARLIWNLKTLSAAPHNNA